MTLFIGDGFVIVSGPNGDVIFSDSGIAVDLKKNVKDVLVMPTLGCAEIALMLIMEE